LSPGGADDALALLHELQVHQIELELQDESLRDSLAELETDLLRQAQLYDSAPAGLFTIDSDTVMSGMNLTAAGLMGREREMLLGRPLGDFLAPYSRDALHALLARVREGGNGASETLQLTVPQGSPRAVRASANADPANGHFQLAFVDLGEQAT
jgi:PAS domain S-box-containing protein